MKIFFGHFKWISIDFSFQQLRFSDFPKFSVTSNCSKKFYPWPISKIFDFLKSYWFKSLESWILTLSEKIRIPPGTHHFSKFRKIPIWASAPPHRLSPAGARPEAIWSRGCPSRGCLKSWGNYGFVARYHHPWLCRCRLNGTKCHTRLRMEMNSEMIAIQK